MPSITMITDGRDAGITADTHITTEEAWELYGMDLDPEHGVTDSVPLSDLWNLLTAANEAGDMDIPADLDALVLDFAARC